MSEQHDLRRLRNPWQGAFALSLFLAVGGVTDHRTSWTNSDAHSGVARIGSDLDMP